MKDTRSTHVNTTTVTSHLKEDYCDERNDGAGYLNDSKTGEGSGNGYNGDSNGDGNGSGYRQKNNGDGDGNGYGLNNGNGYGDNMDSHTKN